MNDLELLKLAAKAMGINHHHIDDDGVWWRKGHLAEAVHCWNPRTDDGDRLRLIRTLKMSIDYADCGVSARYDFGRKLAQEWWGGDEGDEAHAVLRVAAEIGRSML